jgi:hypothetical protein
MQKLDLTRRGENVLSWQKCSGGKCGRTKVQNGFEWFKYRGISYTNFVSETET